MIDRRSRVAVFVSFSGRGGVEKMVVNLLRGFIAEGVDVDLVLAREAGPHGAGIPRGVNVVRLGSGHTYTALPALVRYLRRARPDALLAAKDRAAKVAIVARRLAGVDTKIVLRIGTTVSAALAGRGRLRRWAWTASMRLFYPGADLVVAVSRGVADDVAAITGLPPGRLRVIANPVVDPALADRGRVVPAHPWFAGDGPPVVLGAGRLTRQKDFPTLIRAFAAVRRTRPARLVILGEGRTRGECQALAADLGAAGDVDLPGFVDDPVPFMGHAAVFVLSSLWEGSPNVLTEALALGTPVVATDCPSGPREILAGGEVAPLVAPGDHEAMARAILDVLDRPPPPERLRAAAKGYSIQESSRAYLDALGVEGPRSKVRGSGCEE
jgi:glycosyltransferase involved in cell wall biosynthesis